MTHHDVAVVRATRLNQTTRQGFTLVELLVVVAVISMLFALLATALTTAKEKGRSAKCVNNLRQISLLMLMYSHENSGFIPSLTSASPNHDPHFPTPSISAANGGGNSGGGNNGGGNNGGGNNGGGNNGGGNNGGGNNGGGNNGGGGPFPDCAPDANGMTYICHVAPGSGARTTMYVGFSSTGPTGHSTHADDLCGPCEGYIGAYYNGFLDSLYFGYLNGMLGSQDGLTYVQCPTDLDPEYLFVVGQDGTPVRLPISYNENMEIIFGQERIDKLPKAANTVMLYDGRPSDLIGSYSIFNYNTKYVRFRHLDRANVAYADGHVESHPTLLTRELLLY
jgi:prepilin-type N-terminal cleavage/methylation domain-containing protein/prepilin-type processing-associated H-X9-DG protein